MSLISKIERFIRFIYLESVLVCLLASVSSIKWLNLRDLSLKVELTRRLVDASAWYAGNQICHYQLILLALESARLVRCK